MRVRRTCHRCQTTFGPDKICVNCQHTRCKKCPRYPPPTRKPSEPEQGAVRAILDEKKARAARGAGPVELPRRTRKEVLTMPSRTGGQDLVRRPVRQRVRRTCHECETLFPTEDTIECINCGHIRCKICPRDPYVHFLLSLMNNTNWSDPNYTNTPMDTQEMFNRPSNYPSGRGESLASESGTPVTYALRCIGLGRDTVRIVVRRGGPPRYGIRTFLSPC